MKYTVIKFTYMFHHISIFKQRQLAVPNQRKQIPYLLCTYNFQHTHK